MATVQTVIIIISCVIFFGRLFFGVFRKFSPFNNKALSLNPSDLTDYNINNLDINSNSPGGPAASADSPASPAADGIRPSTSTNKLEAFNDDDTNINRLSSFKTRANVSQSV
jgi:hypothetical protein